MKHITLRVHDALDLRLKLYSAHLDATKEDAGIKAMEDGIPDWVMSLPPSEARALAAAAARKDEQALADDQEMLDAITGDDDGN